MKSVELISSGYEWVCPNCDTLNKEIEITKQVRCKRCWKKYEVDNAEHAHG